MFVFSNLAISVDGKIATAKRGHFPLGTPADRKQMQVLRRRCDAVLMGASTLRAYRKPCRAQGARKQPFNVVLSTDLRGVSPSWDFFRAPDVPRILIVTGTLSEKRLQAFAKTSTVIRLAASPRLAEAIVRKLGALGIRRLLVEGGGGVMWDFARHDLIDEYNVTVTPRILGGAAAPTLVDGEGFDPSHVLNLKLARCRRLGDELYLVYRKTGRRGP